MNIKVKVQKLKEPESGMKMKNVTKLLIKRQKINKYPALVKSNSKNYFTQSI